VTSNQSRNEWIRERKELLAEESADCNCAAASSVSCRTRAPVRVGSWLGLVAGIAAALAPKCPLCLAAYLSMLGISVGLARIAPMLFPFGIVVASIAFVSLVRPRLSPSWGLIRPLGRAVGWRDPSAAGLTLHEVDDRPTQMERNRR
jgi:hypothetical protein